MMLFINGAFGVGKTAVAERLVARLPNSLLYDPELVGAALRQIVKPIDYPDDFQDIPLWPPLTVATARLLREQYRRDLVIPMTIWRADYFEQIVGALRRSEPEVHHFCLTARAETIYARLRERPTGARVRKSSFRKRPPPKARGRAGGNGSAWSAVSPRFNLPSSLSIFPPMTSRPTRL